VKRASLGEPETFNATHREILRISEEYSGIFFALIIDSFLKFALTFMGNNDEEK